MVAGRVSEKASVRVNPKGNRDGKNNPNPTEGQVVRE